MAPLGLDELSDLDCQSVGGGSFSVDKHRGEDSVKGKDHRGSRRVFTQKKYMSNSMQL